MTRYFIKTVSLTDGDVEYYGPFHDYDAAVAWAQKGLDEQDTGWEYLTMYDPS